MFSSFFFNFLTWWGIQLRFEHVRSRGTLKSQLNFTPALGCPRSRGLKPSWSFPLANQRVRQCPGGARRSRGHWKEKVGSERAAKMRIFDHSNELDQEPVAHGLQPVLGLMASNVSSPHDLPNLLFQQIPKLPETLQRLVGFGFDFVLHEMAVERRE